MKAISPDVFKTRRSNQALPRSTRNGRFAFLFAAGAGLIGLRILDPVKVGGWLPLHPSCGALTGLPCLFCGMTRALHLLLNGEFAHALYFNWLAFPLVALISGLVGLFSIELIQRRLVIDWRPVVGMTSRRLVAVALIAVALWVVQVCLALTQHKTELLNPKGPLYSVFVN